MRRHDFHDLKPRNHDEHMDLHEMKPEISTATRQNVQILS